MLKVITGVIRREEKMRKASLALNMVDASSLWIARASFEASFALVGVFIRSTSATSTPSAISSWIARRTRDDLPYRRGAISATFSPL